MNPPRALNSARNACPKTPYSLSILLDSAKVTKRVDKKLKQRRKHASLSSSYYQAASYRHLPSPSMSDCTDIPSLPKRGRAARFLRSCSCPAYQALCHYVDISFLPHLSSFVQRPEFLFFFFSFFWSFLSLFISSSSFSFLFFFLFLQNLLESCLLFLGQA